MERLHANREHIIFSRNQQFQTDSSCLKNHDQNHRQMLKIAAIQNLIRIGFFIAKKESSKMLNFNLLHNSSEDVTKKHHQITENHLQNVVEVRGNPDKVNFVSENSQKIKLLQINTNHNKH